jgi:hypothetical protein
MRMPREGDRYRCFRSCPITVLTSWAAPCTGGSASAFPVGEAFVVLSDPAEGATAVSCLPVRYERLHSGFVPEAERTDPLYRGYYLVIETDYVMSRCKRVGATENT